MKTVIGMELTGNITVKMDYMKGIEDYFVKSLASIFEKQISKAASVSTDKWISNRLLVEPYNFPHVKNGNSENFEEFHFILR